MIKRNHSSLAAITAAGLLTTAFALGYPGTSHAQVPPPPVGAPAVPPPGPRSMGQPADPKAAPTAVKTANDALASLSVGQVWVRTAPLGEQQVQATLVSNGKVVARLDFDPATGLLRARGEGAPLPPPPPGGPAGPGAVGPVPPPPAPGGPGAPGVAGPVPPPPAPGNAAPVAPAPGVGNAAPVPPPLDANAPASTGTPATAPAPAPAATTNTTATPVNLDQIKARLPDLIKGMSIGQGAEIMPREGFWKVPIISQNRVVGELHLSGDGTQVIEDFMASRDAAIFAR